MQPNKTLKKNNNNPPGKTCNQTKKIRIQPNPRKQMRKRRRGSLTIHQSAYAVFQNSFTVFAKPSGQNLQNFRMIQLLQQPHQSIPADSVGPFLGHTPSHDFHQRAHRKETSAETRQKLWWKSERLLNIYRVWKSYCSQTTLGQIFGSFSDT